MLKASIILSTYHGLCGICHGMGIVPDYDIISELYSLVGSEAIKILVSAESLSQCEQSRSIPFSSDNENYITNLERDNS